MAFNCAGVSGGVLAHWACIGMIWFLKYPSLEMNPLAASTTALANPASSSN